MSGKMTTPRYSPDSVNCMLAEPGRTLLSSVEAGWSSLLLQVVRSPGKVESFDTLATPDQLVVLVLEGTYDIGTTSSRSSSTAQYRPGCGGMTAAMNTSRLRWSSTTHKTLKTLHLYLPQVYFEEAIGEYRRPGHSVHTNLPDVLGFADPVVFAVARSLAEAARDGAPDLYADTGARFLASHLLLQTGNWRDSVHQHRTSDELTDRRLRRVLEFMLHHFAEPLTVGQLAGEAAISRFHFVRLFKEKVGLSPGRYLVKIRMEYARRLLEQHDISISEIAAACGYTHPGHFASAFHKLYALTPSAYRTLKRL